MAGQIKAVIFDFDGTLADTFVYRLSAWQEAFKDLSLSMDETQLRDMINEGIDNRSIIKKLLPDLDSHIVKSLLDRKRELRTGYEDQIKLYPEAVHVLKQLRSKGFWLAICTGTSESTVRTVLGKHHISSLISVIVGEESIERAKPDPESLCSVLDRLNIMPADVLFVGDTETDRRAAADSGIRFFQTDRSSPQSPLSLYNILWFLGQELNEIDNRCSTCAVTRNEWLGHEYDALKKEILQYQRFRLQILAVVVAALTIVGSLPFRYVSAADSLISSLLVLLTVLSPYLLVIPGAYFTYLLSRHITYIGTYLSAFHEKQYNRLGWETARQSFNEIKPEEKITTKKSFAYFYASFGLYAFLFSMLVAVRVISICDDWSVIVLESIGVHVRGIILFLYLGINGMLLKLLYDIVATRLYGFKSEEFKDRFAKVWDKVLTRDSNHVW